MARESSPVEALTGREAEVLACLADGLSNSEIAVRLFLSTSTVKWYVKQLNSKLGTTNRDEIVQRARSVGLLDGDRPEAGVKHNLPYQTTPFIGRDAELEDLAQMLRSPEVRLVTILAPGGMGKTRLALEAAEQQLYNFADGVYFVPLQPLAAVDQIVPAIAQQIGFQFAQDERSPKQQVLDYLTGKKLLLVADNWEHLLEGAPLISEMLRAAPEVTVLTTSREKLNLSGETVYTLQGMEFPTWETPEDALRYDAVKLLVQAAKRMQPDFAVTQDNLDYVARVCRLTEGMPLGILLATGWLDTLSLERIAEEIQKNVNFLETEMRDVPERQRSIRAVFEAAWARLAPAEQQVFMKLTVFRGGCTPEAAEVVSEASLRTLQTLVNKALVTRTKTGRYDIHELLRHYGYEPLASSGNLAEVLRQHSRYYTEFLHAREADLKGGRQLAAVEEIEAEVDNLRLAWYQALADQDIARIEEAAFSLMTYGNYRSRTVEFAPVFVDAERALRAEYAVTLGFGRLLAYYGRILRWLGRYAEAERPLREALSIGRAQDDLSGIAYCTCELAGVLPWLGNHAEAQQLIEESIRLCEVLRDDYQLTQSLNTQGFLSSLLGNSDSAVACERRASQILRRLGDEFDLAASLGNIAIGLINLGQFEESEALAHEALALVKRIKRIDGAVFALRQLGFLEFQKGNVALARQYTEEALQIGREIGEADWAAWVLMDLVLIEIVSNQLEAAEQNAEEAIRRTAGGIRPDFVLPLAFIRLARQDWEGALAAFSDYWKQPAVAVRTFLMAMCMLGLGLALTEAGQIERGLEWVALALTSIHMPKALADSPLVARQLAAIKSELTQEAYAAAWERGKALDFDMTVAELRATYGSDPSQA